MRLRVCKHLKDVIKKKKTLTGEAVRLSLPSLSSMTDVVENTTLGEIP